MGAGAAVLNGGIGFSAGAAVGDGGDGFEDQPAAGEDRAAFGAHVIPAVKDLFVNNTGNLTDFQYNRTDARQFIFRRHIGQGFHNVGNNSKFVH